MHDRKSWSYATEKPHLAQTEMNATRTAQRKDLAQGSFESSEMWLQNSAVLMYGNCSHAAGCSDRKEGRTNHAHVPRYSQNGEQKSSLVTRSWQSREQKQARKI